MTTKEDILKTLSNNKESLQAGFKVRQLRFRVQEDKLNFVKLRLRDRIELTVKRH